MEKICTHCQQTKPLEQFSFLQAKQKHASWCKQCSKEVRLEHYRADPKRHIQYVLNRKADIKRLINEVKTKCVICGEDDPVCLDWHHRDSNAKDFTIARSIVLGYSFDRILTEITKCVCLCANCHRKVHAGRVTVPA